MKRIYRLNSNINEEMDYEEATEYLQEHLHFTLDNTLNLRAIVKQNELIEVLLEAYFITEEIEENKDMWQDDIKERELEYREVQGF